MLYKFKLLSFICCGLIAINLAYAESNNIDGFYTGIGTGINATTNSNLNKTYGASGKISGVENMGNLTSYSLPFLIDAGYRFNPYLAAEFTYTYSGNQQYVGPVDMTGVDGGFWGSQNMFGLTAVGYLPLNKDLYLKGRFGLAYTLATMTTYIGDPGSKMLTLELGLGLQYYVLKDISLDFDYINYGAFIPMHLNYKPPTGGQPNLGVIDTISNNQLFVSLTVHY